MNDFQVRALQILETAQLMASGYPHRMRFRAFSGRYRALYGRRAGAERESGEGCARVLRAVQAAAAPPAPASPAAVRWALGKRHVFLSEGMRQVRPRPPPFRTCVMHSMCCSLWALNVSGVGTHEASAAPGRGRVHPGHVAAAPRALTPHDLERTRPARARSARPGATRAPASRAHRRHPAPRSSRQV